MKRLITLTIFSVLLVACGSSIPPAATQNLPTQKFSTDTPSPTETVLQPTIFVEPTLTPGSTDTPSPLLAQPTANSHYRIIAELDYGWKIITAQQQVRIFHPSDQPISEIVLVVQPNWYPGTFHLDELAWMDGTPITNYTLDGIRLTIPLPEPWEPGDLKELSIAFTLNLPTLDRGEEFGPNPFGYTSRQVNLTDWHPFVPPFVDGEWLVHNPWYYGEHLVYPDADYEVEIQVTNAPEGTVIAASALDQGDGNIHRYKVETARNFIWSVSPEYRVFQQDVDGVTLLGYGFPYDAEIGEAAFETTVESFRLYNQIFGPYPHESLTMVQADFLHGMEYDGLYFLSKAFYNTYDGTPATYLVTIAAHETAHQWWFGLVGNDQALEPWLDEALCTFTELLFYENLHPEALQWWWDYRVDYYEPQGWIDLNIYDSEGYRPYRDAVYLNGMKFLLELRELVGEDVFAAFLQDYVARSTNQIATADDFFAILGEHTNADWSLLKAKYFRYP
jgi:hypothetical protein